MIQTPEHIRDQIYAAEKIWLFLDYDGTLAEFAPTPDHVLPDPELIQLVTRLSHQPKMRVIILSGRRLAHIQRLLPVPNITLAGSYGIEYQNPDGMLITRVKLDLIRPTLEEIKAIWSDIISEYTGFYLEDKGWSLAIHGSKVDDQTAKIVINKSKKIAKDAIKSSGLKFLGGDKFLEIGPVIANKGLTVEYLVEFEDPGGPLMIYLGDDDKDEEAFKVIKKFKGICIQIASKNHPSLADMRLENPSMARKWLKQLLRWVNFNR